MPTLVVRIKIRASPIQFALSQLELKDWFREFQIGSFQMANVFKYDNVT